MKRELNDSSMAILVDITKCTGCEKCIDACVHENKLDSRLYLESEKKDGLSGNRYTSVLQLSDDRFAKKSCVHCIEPGCVNACIAGALKKTPEGPVVYDPEICIGCRYCMLACPLEIPRYEWDEKLPYVSKCDMCYDRVRAGKSPACVDACPNGVLEFGSRSDLLHKAKAHINTEPEKYLDHVYGETEFGGTSVMYISDVPAGELGWNTTMRDKSVADYTWPVISKTPFLGGGVMAFLGGTMFIINRRMKLENQKHEQSVQLKHSDNGKKTDKGA